MAAVAVLMVVTACGRGEAESTPTGPAPGADVDRPASPSADLVRFEDASDEVGLEFRHGAFHWETTGEPVATMGSGLCWIDYDRDGWLDLFVVNSWTQAEFSRWQDAGGLPRSALFRNEGDRFVDVSEAAGADLELRGSGCVAADLDLDGWTDLYVTTARANALLWNEGDGTFREGAEEAGANAFGWQTGAAVGDVDANGWPDLFVAGYVNVDVPIPEAEKGFPNTHQPVRDLLYLNQGEGEDGEVTFREVAEEAGIEPEATEYGLGALFSDLDRDGDLDLYVASETQPNRLYENVPTEDADADSNGLGFRLREQGAAAGVDDENSGMGVAAGDYDADGRLDLFVTNFGEQHHAVLLNESAPDAGLTFRDGLPGSGVLDPLFELTGWGTSWADLDLDTDLDLVVANGKTPVTDLGTDAEPLQAFENLTAQGDVGRFDDLGNSIGLDDVGPLLARGSAIADYDNDGDLDVAINALAGDLVLLRNTGAGGHWLEIQSDDFAPGALVTAALADGTELTREVRAGSRYLSSEDPRLHFGLGDADRVEALTVRWLDGEETSSSGVRADQILSVSRDAG